MKRGILGVLALAVAGVATAQGMQDTVRRFGSAYLPYMPGATVKADVNREAVTAVGPYLTMTVVKQSARPERKEQAGMLVDPQTKTAAVGIVVQLPEAQPAVTPDTLPAFCEQSLPELLRRALNSQVRLRWPGTPTRMTGVVPLAALVQTGFGWMSLPLAISADGRWLVVGGTWALDRDPRAVRREMLANAKIQWDPEHENAVVKVVEFSDYQCPACKREWLEYKPVFTSFGDSLRHGIVNFPLTSAHPWAFKASVAGLSIGEIWPEQVVPFKEFMYDQQATVDASTVDDAVFAFVQTRSLDEKAFRSSYMSEAAMETVLRQMELGHRLGVTGTPTYYANGEALPLFEPDWASKRLQAIIAAGGIPEKAAEIAYTPPTPGPAVPVAAATPPPPPAPKPLPK